MKNTTCIIFVENGKEDIVCSILAYLSKIREKKIDPGMITVNVGVGNKEEAQMMKEVFKSLEYVYDVVVIPYRSSINVLSTVKYEPELVAIPSVEAN